MIQELNEKCDTCIATSKLPEQINEFKPNAVPEHPGQKSARLSSLVLTSPGQLCLLRPISVLVSKFDTVYHKSRYWSCLLRPKLFQSCLVRLYLPGLGLECKKLVSQISGFHYYSILHSAPTPTPREVLKKKKIWP